MMLYPESKSDHLNIELFRHPDQHYRGIPFWSWNCKVTRELIDEQLLIFKEMGFGGVDIHPRTGLNTVYLSDEYMALIRYAVERCKELGLICWLYDDDRFPSGAADGLVTKDPRFRQRCLLLTETAKADFLPDQTSFDCAVSQGKIPKGWYAASYAIGQGTARRLKENETINAEEILRYAYVMLLQPEDWFQGQTYIDVMNPEAVRSFINITHEAYFREIGSAFGSAVPAIFTDEPRMETRTNRHPKQLKSADDHGDVIIPWSDALRERMLEENGMDILDIAPALVWELPESGFARCVFRNAAAEQFTSAFLDQIASWCKAHQILMTGHVLSEDSLSAQAMSLGDCMRCYRSMDLPGIDVLCDDRQFLTVKQASSVAHQMGKEGVVSELYGVTEWNCDFKTFKLQGDWQAALGITIRVPHLAWMSMEGEAKRDWPGSIFYQSPYWKEFSSIENYFARLNTVLTRGKPMINIAIIHPVESMWLHLGSHDETGQIRREMDAQFDRLIKGLLLHQKDFDLISESLLPSQRPFCDENGLHVGDMIYRTLIIPDMETIRSSTLDVLKQFKMRGGRVIFTGKVPEMVDYLSSNQALLFADGCEHTDSLPSLYEKLQTGMYILESNGRPAEHLLYQRRMDGDAEWLFLCQGYQRKTEIETPEQYSIVINGYYTVTLFDPQTSETRTIPAQYAKGSTIISWTAFAEDSLLLKLQAGQADIVLAARASYSVCKTLFQPDSITFSEPNMLLLDYGRAKVDGGMILEKMEILKLDNVLRRELGFKPRYGSMMQPYALEEKEKHALSLYYEVYSETEVPCQLALEHPEKCHILWNDHDLLIRDIGYYVDKAIRRIALPNLKKGKNTLCLSLPYNQKTNLENMYLLGDFDVAVHPAGESLILPRTTKSIGDLACQGMPFWSGEATYSFSFDIEEDAQYSIQVPLFCAAVLTVRLDGRPMGQIAFAPHRLCLGWVKTGRHTLELTAFIGRHNGFGYLHNSNASFRWFGPDAWRTTGDEWTDDYRIKRNGIMSGVIVELKDQPRP